MPRRPRSHSRPRQAPDLLELSSGTDTLAAGHPWVFRDAAVRRLGALPLGHELDVHDAKTGRFLGRGLFEPEGTIAVRIFSRQPGEHFDLGFVLKRLDRALELRRTWLNLHDTNAYRLVNAESDGLPGLVIERFADWIVVQPYSDLWSTIPAPLIERLTALGATGVLLRPRQRSQAPCLDLLAGVAPPEQAEVLENGIRYRAFTQDGVKPGLYLDHRETRQRLAGMLAGRRFMNAFSYTAGFTVAAAAGAACESFNVDQSGWCHDVARENLTRNAARGEHHFITADVLEVLERWDSGPLDAVILDPPAFSTSRRGVQTNKRDLARLVTLGLRPVRPGGLLVVASNEGRLGWPELLKHVARGARAAGREAALVSRWSAPVDFPTLAGFPEGDRLKVVVATAGPIGNK